jgi:hydroxyacylglutathione hydrolase
VGWVADYSKPILLVVDDLEALDFAVRNLLRLGLDNIVGYLRGGVEAWYKEGRPLAKAGLVTVHDLKKMIDSKEKIMILDVRRENEWMEGHIEGSIRIYLGHIPEQVDQLPRDLPIVVVCKTGNRSSFGASVLLRAGVNKVYNCLGGIDAWIKSGYPVTFAG